MLEKLKTEPGYEWISESGMTLWNARKTGKISQDQLDYELAKSSLEFLEDYAPKNAPSKPLEVLRFEALKNDEIASMKKADYEAQKLRCEKLKKAWRSDFSEIQEVNISNLLWLRRMKKVLELFKNPNVFRVDSVISEHESFRKGF